jgi:lysophospholipase L1-like esterase
MRFTALGDSLTVGLGDPVVDGSYPTLLDSGWRGWAGLLAESLDGVEFRNIACCGAQTRDVATSQLPRALAMKPAVASVIVGTNDTLRGAFSIEQIARDLSSAVGALARTGAVVLTARLPDPGRVLGVPDLVARPLARRVYAINAVVDELAARHGTVHLDFACHPEVQARSMWGIDRLHPSERAHRLVARLYAERLATIGLPVCKLPDVEPTEPIPARWDQTRWLATKGTAWAARRSRDLLPTLARLVAREWWYEKRDRVAELDEQLHAELAAVKAHTLLTET